MLHALTILARRRSRRSPAPGPPPRRPIPSRNRAGSSSRSATTGSTRSRCISSSIRSQDLVGREVAAAQFEAYDYRTRDGPILIDVLEFKRRGRGAGVTVYPFGLSVGPTLALRGSIEELPTIRDRLRRRRRAAALRADRRARVRRRRRDCMSPIARPAGASEATPSSAAASAGSRATSATAIASSPKAAAGSTPVRSAWSCRVKFAWNHLTEPVDHHFLTVPITLRGTLILLT